MSSDFKELYEFSNFRLNVAERFLLRGEERLAVPEKVFETLCVLVRRGGELVTKDDLMEKVWGDTIVEENNLDKKISALRKILGERGGEKFIETVRGHGFRFVAEVRRMDDLGFENGNRSGDERTTANDELTTEDQKPKTKDQRENPKSQILNPKSNVVALAAWRHEAAADDEADAAESATNEIQNELILNVAPFTVSPNIKSDKFRRAAVAICVLLATAGIGYGLYKLASSSPMIFEAKKTTRLTSTGEVLSAAVSPDGKNVAYVQRGDGQQQSLWMLNVANQSAVELVAPGKSKFRSLKFAPDGNHFYYQNFSGSLYRMPISGGTPFEISNLKKGGYRRFTFSPDEKHVAFTKARDTNETIIVADADGTNERELFSTDKFRLYVLAWSPDGKTIAVRFINKEKNYSEEIWAVQVDDGTAMPILASVWDKVNDAAWMPDGKSLLVAAEEYETNLFQIWQVPYPNGEAHKITTDFNIYNFVSLSTNGRFLVSPRMERVAHIWTMPANDTSRARQLTFEANEYHGAYGISWLPDDKIVYNSSSNGGNTAWIIQANGNGYGQFLNSSFMTTASPDGRFIVFANTTIEKSGLWRMNPNDYSSLLQLTSGADTQPTFSPDGKWLVYVDSGSTLQKVSIDGGEPVTLQKDSPLSISPAVSPDGKQIAFYFWGFNQGETDSGIALMSSETGETMKTFNVQPDRCQQCSKMTLQWTTDGRAINYVKTENGLSNIWQQPIDGSAPVQVTNFTTDRIFNFAFSPDGSQLALSRGTINSDVVLIENAK